MDRRDTYVIVMGIAIRPHMRGHFSGRRLSSETNVVIMRYGKARKSLIVSFTGSLRVSLILIIRVENVTSFFECVDVSYLARWRRNPT